MMELILSCDWGTSSFRLRLINIAAQEVLAETTGAKGIAAVYNEWLQSGREESGHVDFYKTILLSQINKLAGYSLDGVPIIISGMASSAIGIKELAYGAVPFDINAGNLPIMKMPPDKKFNHEIVLVSGLKTSDDVMRGEETMLVGCDIDDANEQLFIFPGTHSKHAIVKNKILLDFKTYMTGEMFDLLANKSILSKSVIKNNSDEYDNLFGRGVADGASGDLLNKIFHVRTGHLFKTITPEGNYHYLSGLMIGSELQQIPLSGIKIHLVCGKELAIPYRRALQVLGVHDNLQYSDADKALIGGHCKLAVKTEFKVES